MIVSTQNIGSLVAYPISPYLADGLGRRPAIFIGASIMCVATIVQTASTSVGMFIGARQVSSYFPSTGIESHSFLLVSSLVSALPSLPFPLLC